MPKDTRRFAVVTAPPGDDTPRTMEELLRAAVEKVTKAPMVGFLLAVEHFGDDHLFIEVGPPSRATHRGLAELIYERAPVVAGEEDEAEDGE